MAGAEAARARRGGRIELPRNSEREAGTFYCTFCGKSQHKVAQLIAGPGPTFICDECALLCAKIVGEKRAADAEREAARAE